MVSEITNSCSNARARAPLAALVIASVSWFASLSAFAGDWHYRQSALCSDCHTQHNSENGAPMRTDNNPTPAPILLRRGSADDLCLSCHAGTNGNAPSVMSSSGFASAAGAFSPNAINAVIDAGASYGHHINTPAPVVPPGGTIPMTLTCTTCHDPHGNDNYRNLRPDPTRTNQPAVSVLTVQTNTANGSNPAQVYTPSNIIYKSGVSAWCIRCHSGPTAGDHVADRTIWGAVNASYATWAAVTLPRVPVHSPTDNIVPSNDDQVICISCHKAHGTANAKATIFADDVSIDSTCQECHNQ